MADARSMLVQSASTGAPLEGASGTALAWSKAGVVRAPPPVTELGEGEYQVEPTDADELEGTVVLVDFGALAHPRYFFHAVYLPDNSNQFWGVVVTTPAGALWTGAAPTVGSYRWADETDRLANAPLTVPVPPASTSLFTWTPSSPDIAADATIRVDGPAGSSQPFWNDHVRTVTQPPLPGDLGDDLEKKVFAALASWAPLIALVPSTRTFPDALPQETELPALVVNVISDVPRSSLDGAVSSALHNARVQVDAYATTRVKARQVGEAVKGAMDLNTAKAGGFDGWFASSRNLYDDRTRHYRMSMDFNVWR